MSWPRSGHKIKVFGLAAWLTQQSWDQEDVGKWEALGKRGQNVFFLYIALNSIFCVSSKALRDMEDVVKELNN